MAFLNSMLIGFLLGVPTLVAPPCHSTGAEPACGVGEGHRRKPQHGARSGWAPFLSSACVTCGMDKAGAAALTPPAWPAVPRGWYPADLVVPLAPFRHWFLPAPAWVIPPA